MASVSDQQTTTPETSSNIRDDTENENKTGPRVPISMSEEARGTLKDKMKDMFAKFITDIDEHVLDVGKSQCELNSQLDSLIATLDSIKIDEKLTRDISENAKRISSLKSRLTVIHSILNDSRERCTRTLTACGTALQNTSSTSPLVPSTSSAPSKNTPAHENNNGGHDQS